MAREIRIRIDGTDLERRLERIRRDEERPGALPGTRLVLANGFIDALVENGLLPKGTTWIRITGALSEPLRLDYETIATSELVEVAGAMREADDHDEARMT